MEHFNHKRYQMYTGWRTFYCYVIVVRHMFPNKSHKIHPSTSACNDIGVQHLAWIHAWTHTPPHRNLARDIKVCCKRKKFAADDFRMSAGMCGYPGMPSIFYQRLYRLDGMAMEDWTGIAEVDNNICETSTTHPPTHP